MKEYDYSDFGYEVTEVDNGPFDAFNLREFEQWLRIGLEEYFLEGQGAWAFPGAEGDISSQHDSLPLGLRKTFVRLPARQRDMFRQAVSNVLESLEPIERNIPLFENLLVLAGLLPVPQVLTVLPTRIGNGFFGLTKNREGESLFTLTLLAITELADKAPGEEVVSCLHDMIGSKNFFDPAYAGYVLTGLCVADATGLVDHLDRLRLSLAAMFDEFNTNREARQKLAKRVLDTVGLEQIAKALPRLKYNRPGFPKAPSDDWLQEGLFRGPTKILQKTRTNGFVFIHRPENPTVRVAISEQDKPCWNEPNRDGVVKCSASNTMSLTTRQHESVEEEAIINFRDSFRRNSQPSCKYEPPSS